MQRQFQSPPTDARPWVYWYFMDGNMTREGITADLEAMKAQGIGGAIFLEVDIGIPRGPVAFMGDEWRQLFVHAVKEARRLGIEIALGAGPGWCGAGGPWVKPDDAMQVLVASSATVTGPGKFNGVLEKPEPRDPFFGKGTLNPAAEKQWREFYRDVAVLAFPTPVGNARIENSDEKALYYRAPYSSQPGVKPYLTESTAIVSTAQCIGAGAIVDLTSKLSPDGHLDWLIRPGQWTILRFGRRLTGQMTRPAPAAGLGLETNKFERRAIESHLDDFVEPLMKMLPPDAASRTRGGTGGLTDLHFDSWEMSSQNWSEHFRDEFKTRRGYDPLPWLPALTGRIVDSTDKSERFLWDLRQTAQELVIENQIGPLKNRAKKYGLSLSIEPYDMNPCSDLALGAPADVPMCEFWSQGYGFKTEYSCIEAVSIAHTNGRAIVGAEAFTAGDGDKWLQHPASMKSQADWALAAGINRLVIHRFQHQPTLTDRPGMTMGIYGVHWDRTQTWWNMAGAFHTYLSRCQHMLRQGLPVADILYLAREGAPNVFRPPTSATLGDPPDRRGYNFDACAPETLIRNATVRHGKITFPDGMSYRVLVLPSVQAMTPALLRKVLSLVEDGATVLVANQPPAKSPSLTGYQRCDEEVKQLAGRIWRNPRVPHATAKEAELYPDYEQVAQALFSLSVPPDFEAPGEKLRYSHRHLADADIYFISNRTTEIFEADCLFRSSGPAAQWWDPMTGKCRRLQSHQEPDGRTRIRIRLEGSESGFLIFSDRADSLPPPTAENFPKLETAYEIPGPWEVQFDPTLGGPSSATHFSQLQDWSQAKDPAIRFYSGQATYRTTFDAPPAAVQSKKASILSLGDVKNIAQVSLNGTDLGIAWCTPWHLEIPPGILKNRDNRLEITVANLWCNRLIGDAALPPEKRITRSTWYPFPPNAPLQKSGLLGPVTVRISH